MVLVLLGYLSVPGQISGSPERRCLLWIGFGERMAIGLAASCATVCWLGTAGADEELELKKQIQVEKFVPEENLKLELERVCCGGLVRLLAVTSDSFGLHLVTLPAVFDGAVVEEFAAGAEFDLEPAVGLVLVAVFDVEVWPQAASGNEVGAPGYPFDHLECCNIVHREAHIARNMNLILYLCWPFQLAYPLLRTN